MLREGIFLMSAFPHAHPSLRPEFTQFGNGKAVFGVLERMRGYIIVQSQQLSSKFDPFWRRKIWRRKGHLLEKGKELERSRSWGCPSTIFGRQLSLFSNKMTQRYQFCGSYAGNYPNRCGCVYVTNDEMKMKLQNNRMGHLWLKIDPNGWIVWPEIDQDG